MKIDRLLLSALGGTWIATRVAAWRRRCCRKTLAN